MEQRTAKLSLVIQDEIRKATGRALQTYTSLDNNKRVELEQQGINMATLLYQELLPIIDSTRIRKLLIIMEEGIGNTIMLTPAIESLKANHPRLHITVWCKKSAAQVICNWDKIDKVITEFDDDYYDLCFVTIWGKQTYEDNQEILKQHVKTFLNADLKTHHESIQHLSISEFMDGTSEMILPHCQIAAGEEAEFVDMILKKTNTISENYIIFGDTALRNHGWDCKKWPYYKEFAELIYKKFPEYKIILIGDKEDYEEFSEKEWPENVVLDFAGTINIPQLAYLIKNAKMYIGNDTGPTHIAAAVGTKTYAIFGPTLISKNKPIGKNVTILSKGLPCQPCQYTEKFQTCSERSCMVDFTALEVYNKVFFPEKQKPKLLLVGSFAGGALRNELYIKSTLEKDFGFKVIPFDYRSNMAKTSPMDCSYEILNKIMHYEPEYALICGGQNLIPNIFMNVSFFSPKTKLLNWYVDNRRQIEPWFKNLCEVCHTSFWSTGDPNLLSQIFSQTQKPCQFLPITPDDKVFKPLPIELKKDTDVIFVGTPHSPERIQLLEYLVKNNVNIEIYGNGQWPDSLKSRVHKGIFDKEFVQKLNQSKIVLNINIVNDVPLYFSDRYFQPMAVKTVGLNKYIPKLEDMFENNKHMVFFNSNEECLEKINELLKNDKKREYISEEGYKLYKDKYTLKHILQQMIEGVNA